MGVTEPIKESGPYPAGVPVDVDIWSPTIQELRVTQIVQSSRFITDGNGNAAHL